MSYSRNFGFRSTVNIVRSARFKTPASASGADANGFLQGTAVVADPSNAGVLTRPAADAIPTANSGIVIYEHIQSQGVDPFLTTPLDPPFNLVPLGRFAQVVHGIGVKVWFRNTADSAYYDGRTLPGVTLVTTSLGSVSVGDQLSPSGSNGQWAKTTNAGHGWLTVTSVNATTGSVEAVFNF
jgi:hypothetical protein